MNEVKYMPRVRLMIQTGTKGQGCLNISGVKLSLPSMPKTSLTAIHEV